MPTNFLYRNFVVLFLLSVCQAELYQVNKSATLCTSEEAVFVCSHGQGASTKWTISTLNNTLVFSLNYLFDRKRTLMIDDTPVKAEVIFDNSTLDVSTLTIVATLTATIVCLDRETITYNLEDGESLFSSLNFLLI